MPSKLNKEKQIQAILGIDAVELDQILKHAAIDSMFQFAMTMKKKIRADRIPVVIRRKDLWLKDHSMLETLLSDGLEPVVAYLDRLFSYIPE